MDATVSTQSSVNPSTIMVTAISLLPTAIGRISRGDE